MNTRVKYFIPSNYNFETIIMAEHLKGKNKFNMPNHGENFQKMLGQRYL